MTIEDLIQSKLITFKGTTFATHDDVVKWMEKAMRHVAEHAEEEYRDFLNSKLKTSWAKTSSS